MSDAAPIRRVLDALGDRVGRKVANGYSARCPSHDDETPSLSIAEGKDGRVLLHCKSGCRTEDVAEALGMKMSDLFRVTAEANGNPQRDAESCVPGTVWTIRDVNGVEIAQHCRFNHPDGSKESVRWKRGGQWGLRDLRLPDLPLYGCEHLAGKPDELVFICEGEKATDALLERGFLACGSVTGAASTPSNEVLQILKGRCVVLWPDADDVGRQHMARIAKALAGVAKDVRTIDWPEAPDHGDAADWDGTTDELQGLIDAAGAPAKVEATAPRSPLAGSWDPFPGEWLTDPPPRRRYLIRHPDHDGKPCAPRQGDGLMLMGKAATLTSAGGTGKTNAICQLAVAVATGNPWLNHFHVSADAPSRVLLLLGEEDTEEVRRRLFYVCKALKLSDAERDMAREGVVALPLSGKVCPLLGLNGPDEVFATPHLDVLHRQLKEHAADEGWGLVVVDPQARFAGVEVESNNHLATRFVVECENLTKAPGNPAVLVVAHSSKLARRAGTADSRGVTALTDGFRLHMTLADQSGGGVLLEVQKNNYGRHDVELRLERGENGLLFVESQADRERREQVAEDVAKAEAAERLDRLVDQAAAAVRSAGKVSSKEALARMIGGPLREDLGDITTLHNSIRDFGLLEPLLVDAENHLVDGFRRLHVLEHMGAAKVLVARLDRKLSVHERHALQIDIEETCQPYTIAEKVKILAWLEGETA